MNVILNFVLYFLVFAALHSILATGYIKNKAEVHLKYLFRFYRIIYNIISFITFAPVFIIWATALTPHIYSIPGWLYPLVLLIRLAAAGLFVYAGFQTDLLEFAGIRQSAGKRKNMLITKGAYGIVRHPLYTGGVIMLFTKMDMSQLDLIATILISIYFAIGAFIEERRLLAVFGEEYRKYREDVSMFIPAKWIWKLF